MLQIHSYLVAKGRATGEATNIKMGGGGEGGKVTQAPAVTVN